MPRTLLAIFVLLAWNGIGQGLPLRSQTLQKDFVPSQRKIRIIAKCLNDEIPHSDHRCSQLNNALSRMSTDAGTSSTHSRKRRYRMLHTYERELIDEANGVGANSAQFATCAEFSPSVRNELKKFYKKRIADLVGMTRVPVDRLLEHVDRDTIVASFRHPGKLVKCQGRQPEAVDLVLQRARPCELEEQFGLYDVLVETIGNGTATVLYRAEQASCPSLDGGLMIASLKTLEPWRWLTGSRDELLTLRVSVRPRKQLLIHGNDTDERISVLRRAVSLTFFCKTDPTSTAHRGPRFDWYRNSSVQPKRVRGHRRRRRQRRSPSIRSTENHNSLTCRRISYHVNFVEPWQLQLTYPSRYDVGECYGSCSHPLSEQMNTTNHALTMTLEKTFNRHPPFEPTVDCVPIAYRSLYQMTYGNGGDITVEILENEVARHCGCL